MPAPHKLWRCPKCGREFANAGQWHSCGRFTEGDYLEGKRPSVMAVYRRLRDTLKEIAPITVSPTKTMICFKLQSTVVAVQLKSRWVEGSVLLGERIDSPRFLKVVAHSSRSFAHRFRLHTAGEIDSEFKRFLRAACQYAAAKYNLPMVVKSDEERPMGEQIADVLRKTRSTPAS
ncbi:MAG: DUF5655 domain-containing protein [Verrucomicrobiota bacterium]